MPFNYLLDSWISLALLIIIIGMSAWALWDDNFKDKHVLVPYDMLIYKEYWRLITSGFVHGNYLHLLFNCVTFFFFAFMLEHWLGHVKFAILYFSGLLISNLIVTLIYRNDSGYSGTLGASGAISALLLSAAICNPYLKFGLPIVSDIWPVLQIPGYIVGFVYIIYSLVSAFRKTDLPINHLAHLIGALTGLGLTFVLKPNVLQVLEKYMATL
ncbi:MAG: rhomboid family intramembrane serine protease [Bacteroidota bacterium]